MLVPKSRSLIWDGQVCSEVVCTPLVLILRFISLNSYHYIAIKYFELYYLHPTQWNWYVISLFGRRSFEPAVTLSHVLKLHQRP
jgi:hypothetical protein